MRAVFWSFAGPLLVSMILGAGCRPARLATTKACPEATQFVRKATNLAGTVYYDAAQDRYGIQVATSMDSADMGLVCNLPKAYQKQQLKVRFSGQYYAYDKPVSAPAGYRHYYLSVDSITRLD